MKLDYYTKKLSGEYKTTDINGKEMIFYEKVYPKAAPAYKVVRLIKSGGTADIYSINTKFGKDVYTPYIIKIINPQTIIGKKKNLTEEDEQIILEVYNGLKYEVGLLQRMKSKRKIDSLPRFEHEITENPIELQKNLGFKNKYDIKENVTVAVIMEYLPGNDLEQIINLHKRYNKKIPIKITNYIIHKMCEPLDTLHNGIERFKFIHKDIDPNNTYVSGKKIFILDFGISSKLEKICSIEGGKVGWIPPEELRNTEKGDMYQLGITYAVLLTSHQEEEGLGLKFPLEIQNNIMDEPDAKKGLEWIKYCSDAKIIGKKESEIIERCLTGNYENIKDVERDLEKTKRATEKEVEYFSKIVESRLI